jgi:hypothetical protein
MDDREIKTDEFIKAIGPIIQGVRGQTGENPNGLCGAKGECAGRIACGK